MSAWWLLVAAELVFAGYLAGEWRAEHRQDVEWWKDRER